jgi:hypothetical protein
VDIKREKVFSLGSANAAYCGRKIIEKVAVEIFKFVRSENSLADFLEQKERSSMVVFP